MPTPLALPPPPPALRAKAVPAASPVVLTAGQAVSIGGVFYQIGLSSAGVPTLQPLTPIVLNIGDKVTIGTATYQVSPYLSLSLLPAPLPGAGPAITGYLDPLGQPVRAALPGERISVIGSGFGATAGTLFWMGVAVPPLSWSDTRIDFVITGRGPPVGDVTIIAAGGAGYYESLAFPVNAP